MNYLRQLGYRQSFVVLIIGLMVSSCTLATVRPIDPATGKAIIGNEDQAFNATNLVAEMWESQMLPTLQKDAAPVATVLEALRQNTATASEKYGHRPGNEQPYSFMVTGTGKVLTVNTESRAGIAPVDLNDDGKADVTLAVGPVIRGTALRDAAPFIAFNQFTNQMEYAAVSNELNATVNAKVLGPLGDLKTLDGKTVTFFGAFTIGATLVADKVIITPAILTVEK